MPEQDGAAPPGGGRMNHDVMDRASKLPVTGPAATDTTAASGGLDLPGRALEGSTTEQQRDRAEADAVPPPTVTSADELERRGRGLQSGPEERET